MAARIFLTGASGYLGGEVLDQISKLSVKHNIHCLVRTQDKATAIKTAYPNVEIVTGDLDDAELIEQEALQADIVLHLASTRHEASTRAIIQGLSNQKRSTKGYWLQIGGASMFAGDEIKTGTYGEPGMKTYDDVDDIEEIRAVIKASPARIVDNLYLAQTSDNLNAALVAGPIIYGRGSGPCNTISMQGPAIARYAIQHGETFQVGKGQNAWSTVHVFDIGKLFVLLLQAAVDKRDGVWNEDGFYLPENGKISFGDLARLVSKAGVDGGFIKSSNIRSLSTDEVNSVMDHGAAILGTNAQTHSTRANKHLGWQPIGKSLAEETPGMLKYEAQQVKKQSA